MYNLIQLTDVPKALNQNTKSTNCITDDNEDKSILQPLGREFFLFHFLPNDRSDWENITMKMHFFTSQSHVLSLWYRSSPFQHLKLYVAFAIISFIFSD